MAPFLLLRRAVQKRSHARGKARLKVPAKDVVAPVLRRHRIREGAVRRACSAGGARRQAGGAAGDDPAERRGRG